MYVNVFHLKISSGLTHNAEYFFNGRSLTSDELLGQLLWIITCYEIIGTQIHAMNCDAGGPNTGPVNTIHNEKKIPIGWLPEECVSFLNPVDPDHWVCIMLCNVNNFKNYQGALNQSEPDDTRFFAKGGIGWGWPALTHFYHADVRVNANAPQTALWKSSVEDLDKLTAMCVPLAKHPFMYNTISFECGLIAQEMGCL